jgi:hypothetical protein
LERLLSIKFYFSAFSLAKGPRPGLEQLKAGNDGGTPWPAEFTSRRENRDYSYGQANLRGRLTRRAQGLVFSGISGPRAG